MLRSGALVQVDVREVGCRLAGADLVEEVGYLLEGGSGHDDVPCLRLIAALVSVGDGDDFGRLVTVLAVGHDLEGRFVDEDDATGFVLPVEQEGLCQVGGLDEDPVGAVGSQDEVLVLHVQISTDCGLCLALLVVLGDGRLYIPNEPKSVIFGQVVAQRGGRTVHGSSSRSKGALVRNNGELLTC